MSNPRILRGQVERLLKHERAQNFTRDFTGQWLSLRQLDATSPDKKLYPEFDDYLMWSMPEETTRFFDKLLADDRSILNFVHSDFSILNARLAKQYGIPGVVGAEFRSVRLPADAHRGGVMGQAAILKVTANGTVTKRRMVAICTNLGIHAPYLNPAEAGKGYKPTPYLEPLAALRDDFTVVSGVSHPDVDGGHSAEASFLTMAPHPGTSGFRNSISLDQFAVERLGPDTRFPSLILNTGGGSISWTRGGVQLPADGVPSKVFARLFLTGSAKEVESQVRRIREGRSVLDTVNGQAKSMARGMGGGDRDKLDEYFTSVRELEHRMVQAEEWSKRPKPQVSATIPKDIADRADIIGRSRLMYDLIHLAIQTDSSRIFTLNIEGTGLVPPIEGVNEAHHSLSHHGKDPVKLAQLKTVELAEFTALSEFLTKLKGTREEGSNLLDRTMVYYGSNLGNASSHSNKNMPCVFAGGGFRHGQHLAFNQEKNEPLGNLYVSMLQRMGVETDTFATAKATLMGLEATGA